MGRDQPQVVRGGQARECGADGGVGRDAAGDDQRGGLGHGQNGVGSAVGQHVGDGTLERGGDVGGGVRGELAGDGGLEAREAEVAAGAAEQRARQGDRGGVAGRRETLQRGAARPAEAEQLADFVERLADRVVDGAA